jgi:NAD(P)-dependent dehydrogenase (short-subunit alcohol dehydrogenase family)
MTTSMGTERFSLKGKTALVTGGTGLLGAHLSRGLAAAGAHVTLVSRTAEKQEALAAEIAASGGSSDYVTCDMGDLDAVAAMCDEVWSRHGSVEIIVHNATGGGSGNPGGIVTASMADVEGQADVIYRSALVMFRNLCPRMVEANGGSIVTVVSSTGYIPQKNMLAYGMAKGSLLLLTKYAAQEFGPAVRANCITPGTIDTAGTMKDHPIAQLTLPRISLGRFGESEECVGATVFLASDAASYISGQVYLIDGGRF